MPNPAARLITLIMLLQRKPHQKAADLAAELGVSVRTLHRYMAMLDEMGIPIYSERGPQGGFSLVRGYKMAPLVFTPDEAVAVYLGTSLVGGMWGDLYSAPAAGALAKLDNVLPEDQRHEAAWARRALVATGLHRGDLPSLAPTLEQVRLATRHSQRLQMTYLSLGRKKATRREMDPYAMVHRWGWWYTIGYCHLRQEVRTFRLDRIQTLEVLDQTFVVPEDFNLQDYLERELQAQPQVKAALQFLPEAAWVAWESQPYWDSLETLEDGSVHVTLTAPNLEWAASTALAYGPILEVISPPELRRMVAQWAAATHEKYQGKPERLGDPT